MARQDIIYLLIPFIASHVFVSEEQFCHEGKVKMLIEGSTWSRMKRIRRQWRRGGIAVAASAGLRWWDSVGGVG